MNEDACMNVCLFIWNEHWYESHIASENVSQCKIRIGEYTNYFVNTNKFTFLFFTNHLQTFLQIKIELTSI